jgi:hypothetical protein
LSVAVVVAEIMPIALAWAAVEQVDLEQPLECL